MKKLSLLIALLSATFCSIANNVTTSAISLGGQNTANHFTLIKYSITWQNSWRTANNENNYDGCWIFAKFRKKNASAWQHATINYVNPGTATACGHTEPVGSTIKTAADGKGVWMYRNAVGSGTVNWANAQLRWNYGVDGVADNDSVEIKLFAVEMVYVPQGAFVLGSNGTEYYHFRRADKDTCFNVTSENFLNVSLSGNTNLYATTYLAAGTIPNTFPKGYNAFWCMKYEVSQQQYADFLNNLDLATANALNIFPFPGAHPNWAPASPEIAMHNLAGDDLMSLLDWSGLRPMTEMEFEKACRGANMVPVPNEYAWGNTTVVGLSGPVNLGAFNETWTVGNFAMGLAFPMRCGALATATSTRTQSGGTYYGIMEMSGNAEEFVINSDLDGRLFNGTHGDGNLGSNGKYDTANWPQTGAGTGYRAGNWSLSINLYIYYGQVSDRTNMSGLGFVRYGGYGGRGVRTAE